MKKIEEIIKYDDLEVLQFYIDYLEMIIEMFKKRNIEHKEVSREYNLLIARYNEIKTGELQIKL